MSKDNFTFKNVKSRRAFATERTDDYYHEQARQRNEFYIPEFKNVEQYVDAKITMLQREMYINPTEEELAHLKEMKTETAIDNAVRTIIDRHWSSL